jgi:hypothetical protein
MSRQTTAIILVGAKTSDPWGDPLLRPTQVLRFTENSVPGWQIHPLNGATGVENEPTFSGTAAALNGSASFAHEAVVLIATLVLGDEATTKHPAVKAAERDTQHGGGLVIPEIGFPRDAVSGAVFAVAAAYRLWVIALDPGSLLLQDNSLADLRSWGIQVDVLSAASSAENP